ncbi:radical SAM protein, partial [bacterium]|nr:radical SAM protein [bacterium]
MGFEKRRRTPPQDADRAAGGVARVLKIADDEGVPVAETPPDILLFSPPPWLVTGPPLGLAAVSAYLKAQGWRVKIIDGNTKAYHDAKPKDQLLWRWEYSAFWEDEAEVEKRFGAMLRRLAEEAAAVGSWAIGVNVVHRKEAAVAIFLRRLKELRPDLRIFVGGPGAGWKESRDHLRELAGDLVDGFVVGEGEVVCDELLRRMRKGESLENLPGFMIAGPDGEAKFKPGRVILDMNKLPVPDFGDFEMEHYDDNSLVVEWNRGCVARCTYCSVNDFWNAFRFKGAKAVAHELKTLHDRHGIEKFVIVDPMVNGNPEHLDAICEAIIESGVKVRWSAGISPNRDVPKSTFVKMAAAGCYQLEFGVDSGSNKILRKMGKRFKADQAGRMMRDAHNAGIDV